MEYFEYGKDEVEYLKSRDKVLGKAMDSVGHIDREIIPDLFEGIVYNIVGQQISMKAARTVLGRFTNKFGKVTPETLYNQDVEDIQKLGVSFRKAGYIKEVSRQVCEKELVIDELYKLPDDEVVKRLVKLPGIGVWTCEMLLIFSLNRMNVLSWQDLAIKRGIINLYGLDSLDKETFNELKERYSPYASVASLYLWEVAKNNG